MSKDISETWQGYIDQGNRAVETHPDFEQLDFATAASDTIASILHAALEAVPDEEFDPREVVERALRCYEGDFADKPDDDINDEGREPGVTREQARRYPI